MVQDNPSSLLNSPFKRRLAAVLISCLLLASLAWINPPDQAAQVSTATVTVLSGTAFTPTATQNPIPELNPNPRQTDGVILGAAVIMAVILAGVWTYGRKRKG